MSVTPFVQMRGRARRALRTRGATALGKLPVAPGRAGQLVGRARVAEARRVLKAGGDAEAVVAPLLDADTDSRVRGRAWALVAEARSAAGQHGSALEAARTAAALDDDVETSLIHRRLAQSASPDEAATALARALGQRPRNRAQIALVVEALRSADRESVEAWRTHLARWGIDGLDERLAEVEAEIALVAADPLDPVLAHWWEQLRRPTPAVARALDRRRDWDRLAAQVSAHPPAADDVPALVKEAALELRKAAARALTAGYTSAAETLVNHSLALRPDDLWARDTWSSATDQLRVVREGWTPTPRGDLRLDTAPRHVLSVLAQSLPHLSGGYATRTHGILTGLVADGWSVEAVTRPGFPYDRWSKHDTRVVPPVDEIDGIRYHRVLTDARVYRQYPLASYVDKYAAAIEAHARRHRASLIHASSFHVNGLAAQQAAARLGLPFVYEMRGLEELMKVSRDPAFESSDRHRFTADLETTICHAADRVFVITEALRALMIERGVDAEKLVVLPNGVHTDQFTPRPRDADLAASLGLTGKTVIGYAGGLVDYEGLDLLLEAVALLKERAGSSGPDFHVVVVGDGHFESQLHALSTSLGLDDVVTFTGRVPHDQVASYLSLFDITPFPRLPLPVCEAISPIKPFESMAMGNAVVTSSVAALTEIVDDGRTGLVFDKGCARSLADTLERLLESPALRDRLGGAAREWVLENRDWRHVTSIVDATYRTLLA
ncbi:glycosyltransferase family 4 protein [Nocardioides sp. Root140]|uniref:glycosyltransferase family 4 protein n=1 Tax=Nocardioides sp. Root140 TaxID=1736460 RepID=UPI0006F912F0|nr:glycosyltransferase family 4 protein [Nocardioides sp. Root140]KQY55522.1 hypothetical protein ASD30_16640 [Nocardioides sp. Root140]